MKTYMLKTVEGRILELPAMTLDEAQRAQALLAKAGKAVLVFNPFAE
jgi:hypothetical protein